LNFFALFFFATRLFTAMNSPETLLRFVHEVTQPTLPPCFDRKTISVRTRARKLGLSFPQKLAYRKKLADSPEVLGEAIEISTLRRAKIRDDRPYLVETANLLEQFSLVAG
jgi:hypothetical protein